METVRFEEMGLSEEIQKAVRYMGFEEASPIQAKAIPAMISGIDLIGQAQTGTGKTAAFGIPLLEKVDPKLKKLQAIVLCPTRELAIPGGRRDPQPVQIYAWNQGSADLRRTGYRKADPFLKEWNTDRHRNSGACDGPHAQKDNEAGFCTHGCA